MLTSPGHHFLKLNGQQFSAVTIFPVLPSQPHLCFPSSATLNPLTLCFSTSHALSGQSHLLTVIVLTTPRVPTPPKLVTPALTLIFRLLHITVFWTSLLRWSTGSKTELILYAKSSAWPQYGIYIHPIFLVKFLKIIPDSSISLPYSVSRSYQYYLLISCKSPTL